MRFHILGLPHTVTSKEFNACAYTQKVVKFGKMMKARGHEIIHYGHEDSDLVCDEHVSVLTNDDFKISYGTHDWRKTFFKFDMEDHAYQTFFKNAIREIEKRKQKNDFLLPFWGSGVRPICDAHNDLIVVEPGIGYGWGHWARWKIFESYAIYHAYGGMKNVAQCNQDWYEVVIPNYFDLEDFIYSENKEDYFLYLGRVFDGKGVNIAIEATKLAGVKLVIAGQKEEGYNLPDHVEYIGYADVETRKQLMSRAKASFLASMYIEPFGGVQIENLLSGTPTITTDWGSFAENNLHGITGYRCRTMGDFVDAIRNIDRIKPKDCRKFGENFSLERVGAMYEKYFQDVLNVYTSNGWYCQTSNLNALNKIYPSNSSTDTIETKGSIKQKINKLKTIKTRDDISNIYKDLNINNICEIGVCHGDNFFKMISNEVKVAVGVDVWKNTDKASQNELHYSQNELDYQYNLVLNKAKIYSNDIKIVRKLSHEAALDFPDEYFDFIYIDADHTYESVKKDLHTWWPKLKKGGLIGLHDYENVLNNGLEYGVVKCVNEFILEQNIQPDNFHLTDGGERGFKSCYFFKEENQNIPIEWYYFYTPEYEEWHRHLQSCLEPIFRTVPIKLDKMDVHNQHPSHHFTGSVDRMKIVIDVIKKNLGKKIVFSDVTWVINKDGINELKQIIDNCKETTYAQNSSQTEHINMGLICMYCSLDELELWSYCLGQLECDPNLHEQYVLDRRLKHKPMFNSQKIRAEWIENAEQFEGYLALKIFTPSAADHITRYNHRIETIKKFNLNF